MATDHCPSPRESAPCLTVLAVLAVLTVSTASARGILQDPEKTGRRQPGNFRQNGLLFVVEFIPKIVNVDAAALVYCVMSCAFLLLEHRKKLKEFMLPTRKVQKT